MIDCDVQIDREANLKMPLFSLQRKKVEYADDLENHRGSIDQDNLETYYVCKLQAPFIWDLEEGCTFFAFISDPGCEELQLSVMDWRKRSKRSHELVNRVETSDKKLIIELRSFRDQSDNICYVGEIAGPVMMPLKKGLFFLLNVNEKPELYISRLNHKRHTRHTREKYNETYA